MMEPALVPVTGRRILPEGRGLQYRVRKGLPWTDDLWGHYWTDEVASWS